MKSKHQTISLIAAMAENRVIGRDNSLPWCLPADLKHFKVLTIGKPIVMGRKTWESLPEVLPDRHHIVITDNESYRAAGCSVVHSVEGALAAAGDAPEVMIVGGAAFYQQMLPLAQHLYLTLVQAEVEGDAWFPAYDADDWRELAREHHTADEKNPYAYTFLTLQRVKE
ncbi:type 3 dihydrofolate reductase [Candidatus Vondammii sp. HM_W22]|uniref:type 3 dihydrofolate reductase n=1 Tax=Candidatus Vondammii sp. HM_W22 TaxID=2687299 RepID=UPI001F14632E|nr:type 3 dihydrofolate reductase [Candidatus Vondammii sp. HM_W22]